MIFELSVYILDLLVVPLHHGERPDEIRTVRSYIEMLLFGILVYSGSHHLPYELPAYSSRAWGLIRLSKDDALSQELVRYAVRGLIRSPYGAVCGSRTNVSVRKSFPLVRYHTLGLLFRP